MNYHNKHYITTDAQNRIINGFSDAFQIPKNGDICINTQGSYQFRLTPDGEENPQLLDLHSIALYRWDGKQAVHRTEAELTADRESITKPVSSPTPLEMLQQENKLLKAQITAESDRTDFIEDCIAEMATQVYIG